MIYVNKIPFEDIYDIGRPHVSHRFSQPTMCMYDMGITVALCERGVWLGYILLIPEAEPGVYSIPALATREGYEGRGIMRSLFLEAMARLKPAKLWLEVHEGNIGARALYAKVGFDEVVNPNVAYGDNSKIIMCTWEKK